MDPRSGMRPVLYGVVFLLSWRTTGNAGPPNDDFDARAAIEGKSGSLSASTTGATHEPGEPDPFSAGGKASAWWSWKPEGASGSVAILDTQGSNFDTLLAVYAGGELTALTLIAANDDSRRAGSSTVAFPIEDGVEYAVMVDGYGGEEGEVVLQWNTSDPLANDAFAARAALEGDSGTLAAHNLQATREAEEPAHDGLGAAASLWWSWRPAGPDGTVAVLDTAGSDFDTVLAVYTGAALAELAQIARGDDGEFNDLSSRVYFRIRAGAEYQIAVDGHDGARGRIQLAWRLLPAPANDDFARRAALSGDRGVIEAHNFTATREPKEPFINGNEGGASLWWSWQSPPGGRSAAFFTTQGSDFDTVLGVFRGFTLSKLEEIASDDDSGGDAASAVGFAADPSTDYAIAVDGYQGSQGNIRLSWELLPPLLNDDFASRLPLEGAEGSLESHNIGAGAEAGEPPHLPFFESPLSSVWWSWKPPVEGKRLAILDSSDSSFLTVLAVYTGDQLQNLARVGDPEDFPFIPGRVIFEPTAGTEYQIAVDTAFGETGKIILRWQLVEPAPNDNFRDRILLEGESGEVTLSAQGATLEPGELGLVPDLGGGSVWWRWIAPGDGLVSFRTDGSDFDTVLLIFAGPDLPALTLLASDDDGGEGNASHVSIGVRKGTQYHISVMSFFGEMGVVNLSWRYYPSCGPPPAPENPVPAQSAMVPPGEVELSWNVQAPPVKVNFAIFGEDDRRDYYQVEDLELRALMESTVVVVPRDELQDNGNGTFTLLHEVYGESAGLCRDEPFWEQPAVFGCSGFLVAEDLVATAGHCAAELEILDCSQLAFVFGYRMLGPNEAALAVDASQVYFCSEVLARNADFLEADWAVVRLDRPVEGRIPLRVRRSGRIPIDQKLFTIGYPMGLPVKLAAGAWVLDNLQESFFTANLDAYPGNSGSPVFNADTRVVEGVLVRGQVEPFQKRGNCQVSLRCSETFCPGNEATRVTQFSRMLPADTHPVTYELHFGICGKPLELIAETTELSYRVGPLQPATFYCWQVTARGECGSSKSVAFLFRTAAALPSFLRGDADAGGRVEPSDGVKILEYLFLGGAAPPCLDAADANDDGALSITDPISILLFLFAGAGPLPDPAAGCGPDPSEDGIDCRSYGGCP